MVEQQGPCDRVPRLEGGQPRGGEMALGWRRNNGLWGALRACSRGWSAAAFLATALTWGASAPLRAEVPDALAARELSAPPSDIEQGLVRLAEPLPAEHASAMTALVAEASGDGRRAVVRRTIGHAGGRLELGWIAEMAGSAWTTSIQGPDGVLRTVVPTSGDLAAQFGVEGALLAVERVELENAPAGLWTIERSSGPDRIGRPVVALEGGDGPRVRTRFVELASVAGVPRTLVVDADVPIARVDAKVVAFDERGSLVDGGDAVVASRAADRRSAAVVVTPAREGTIVVAVSVDLDAGGVVVRRTAHGVVTVGTGSIRLLGEGTRSQHDGVRDRIALGLDRTVGALPVGAVVLVAAEAWWIDDAGERPVAWIANLAAVDARGTIDVVLDRRWLARAVLDAGDASRHAGDRPNGRLELRQVRVHDRSGRAVLDRRATVDLGSSAAVRSSEIPIAAVAKLLGDAEPAGRAVRRAALEEALVRGRVGGRPIPASIDSSAFGSSASFEGSIASAAPGAHGLAIVHGYCSGGATFPPSQFTGDVVVFSDPNQNRSNDQFAQILAAQTVGLKSFAAVAHSQGGLASLHLYTFYWSGLDWAKTTIGQPGNGTRLIQSVGCPYQGTPLAGNLAVLGAIFGVGCGATADLSVDGAAAWLSTIPSWARAEVFYWTTQYLDLPFSFDTCEFVADFFLADPNDGVVELFRGQLPGGNSMGHKQGWCHTTGMDDPAQYLDAARNTEMNTNAAR
jgi:hypothetical protein